MLSYFRINDPYRILGLLAVLVLLFLPLLIDPPPVSVPELKSLIIGKKMLDGFGAYTGIIDYTAPLTNFFYAGLYFIFGDSLLARHILAFILIGAQAVIIGIIYIDKRAFPENSFIPALVFGVLYIFSFDTLLISGELLGSFFLLMALNSLFREMEIREDTVEMVLQIGVCIGIASLFAFSFFVYVPGVLLSMLLFSRSSGRKFLLLIVGFLIPHLLTFSFYLIYDGAAELWAYYYLPNLRIELTKYVPLKTLFIPFIVPAFFFLAGLVIVNRESRFTKYQSQILQAMFFWTLFGIIQVIFSKEVRPQTLIVLIPGVAFFISHLLLIIRRRTLAELAFWILVGAMLTVTYSSKYTAETNEAYATFFAKSSPDLRGRILVLEDNTGYYLNNEMSTPFLNWNLSRKIFEQPEYYQNVLLVYEGIRRDPPETIYDPNKLMDPFFRKVPELRRQYTEYEKGYRRNKSATN